MTKCPDSKGNTDATNKHSFVWEELTRAPDAEEYGKIVLAAGAVTVWAAYMLFGGGIDEMRKNPESQKIVHAKGKK